MEQRSHCADSCTVKGSNVPQVIRAAPLIYSRLLEHGMHDQKEELPSSRMLHAFRSAGSSLVLLSILHIPPSRLFFGCLGDVGNDTEPSSSDAVFFLWSQISDLLSQPVDTLLSVIHLSVAQTSCARFAGLDPHLNHHLWHMCISITFDGANSWSKISVIVEDSVLVEVFGDRQRFQTMSIFPDVVKKFSDCQSCQMLSKFSAIVAVSSDCRTFQAGLIYCQVLSFLIIGIGLLIDCLQGMGARLLWIAPGCSLTIAGFELFKKFLEGLNAGSGH